MLKRLRAFSVRQALSNLYSEGDICWSMQKRNNTPISHSSVHSTFMHFIPPQTWRQGDCWNVCESKIEMGWCISRGQRHAHVTKSKLSIRCRYFDGDCMQIRSDLTCVHGANRMKSNISAALENVFCKLMRLKMKQVPVHVRQIIALNLQTFQFKIGRNFTRETFFLCFAVRSKCLLFLLHSRE